MKLHISHGAGGNWFIVQPLEGETQTSMAGTAITHEMAVQRLRDAGRTVYEIDAEPWLNKPRRDPEFCQYCGTSPCQSLGREFGTHER